MSKKIDLATTTNITTSYAGEFAGKYISAALLSSSTIEDGGVEVMPNVKFKSVIQRIETGSLIADGVCNFDATSNVDLTEVVIEPEEFQVNLELCKSTCVKTWESIQMGYSAFNPNGLPTSFADYLVGHVAGKVAAANETNIWQGVTGTAGEYNGLETLAALDATVIDVPTPVALTAANIIDKMQEVVDLIPNSLYGKEDLKLYVSNKAAKLYIRALGGFTATIGAAGSDNKGTQWYTNGQLSFDGIPVFVANGLADNSMVAACTSNLYFGTSLLSDWQNAASVIPVHLYDGSDNVRIVMRMTAGAQIGIADDCVVYS